eukprot:TRINITY_DN13043_c0_g1_i1.p1 TRINITY_DN13043_c0_g1~~TRINITY_DN13043_c0_g1_i1.p1  ORF type:complete len:1393 (-),score=223.10 TRINITY_DN13043_c0_g1_i1:121-4299(-)
MTHVVILNGFKKLKENIDDQAIIQQIDVCLGVIESMEDTVLPFRDDFELVYDGSDDEGDVVFMKWCYFVNQMYGVLALCCGVSDLGVVTLAIDCLDKMMSYGYVLGTVPYLGEDHEDTLANRVVFTISQTFKHSNADIQFQIIKALTNGVINEQCGIHGSKLMESLRVIINIYLTTHSEFIQNLSKGNLEHLIDALFKRISTNTDDISKSSEMNSEDQHSIKSEAVSESEETLNYSLDTKNHDATDYVPHTDNVHLKDCLIVIAGLCKIVKKAKKNKYESLELKGKLFSLYLLNYLLSNNHHVILRNKVLIKNGIRKNICSSVSHTATSKEPELYKSSFLIFHSLLTHYRKHLKEEVGVFFDIFLTLCQSPHCPTNMKYISMQILYEICQDPQLLVDIFVNYDCDIKRTNYFGLLVNTISGLCKGYSEIGSIEFQVTYLCLKCFVTISDSLVQWSSELYPRQQVDSNEEDIENPVIPLYDDDVQHSQKKKKTQIERGITIFNVSPKKGLRFLISNSLLNEDRDSIAEFLFETQDLDAEKVGEYLGDLKNIEVLHAYIDNHHEFKGLPIDIALRQFLFSFRLPPESQQIDRIMLKFAQRWYETNPDMKSLFLSAESAYVLSYAIIMLATDRHNPHVLVKMEKHVWKRALLGQNEDQDFDDSLLDEIFARIIAEPLKVRNGFLTNSNDEDPLQLETGAIAQKAQELLAASLDSSSTYYTATNISYVSPMFEIAWCPVIAALSIILEGSTDDNLIHLCIEGFKSSIRISNVFYMETERNAFISALSKFTNLQNSTTLLQLKNVKCINALLDVACTDGNFLRDSWYNILKCASQIDYLCYLPQDADYTEEQNSFILSKNINMYTLDRIFTETIKLKNYSILDFVRNLIRVSKEELKVNRLFSLQKLVELAVYNMPHRIKIVWFKIWEILSDHFTFAGCHKDSEVAIFSVDSLRQLSTQFMERDELASFHFQKQFLEPFKQISLSKSKKLRMYVMETINVMIQHVGPNIRSGWSTIFSIITEQINIKHNKDVIKYCFEIFEFILDKFYTFVTDNYYEDIVFSLVQYLLWNDSESTNIKAIQRIESCAISLCKGDIVPLELISDYGVGFMGINEQQFKYWEPLLSGLVKGIEHQQIHIRTTILDTLFRILNDNSDLFSFNFWRLLFEDILPPLFENKEGDMEIVTKPKTLHYLVILFTEKYERLVPLLENMYSLLIMGILSDNETLATLGYNSLDNLIQTIGSKYSDTQWSATYEHIKTIITGLVSSLSSTSIKYVLEGKIRVGIFILEMLKDITTNYRSSISSENISLCTDGITESYDTLQVLLNGSDKLEKSLLNQLLSLEIVLLDTFIHLFLENPDMSQNQIDELYRFLSHKNITNQNHRAINRILHEMGIRRKL